MLKRLVLEGRIKESDAMDLGHDKMKRLLKANVLSGHVDKTITFHARHVDEFVKGKVRKNGLVICTCECVTLCVCKHSKCSIGIRLEKFDQLR